MIAWKNTTPVLRQAVYYLRQRKAQRRYFDHFVLKPSKILVPRPYRKQGYQSMLARYKNKYSERERCFVIANGPSLKGLDLSFLKDEITIGCNGIYKNFDDWGFHTDFLLFEDVEQFEIRAEELKSVKGPTMLAAIYNAYAIADTKEWLFFNSPRCMNNLYYWNEEYPQFSKDFASIVHLGSTVSTIMLQWAYHLGFKKVYLLGLDHDYGKLPALFPPGKIVIDETNIDMVKECHFDPNYYQLGDVIGVPDVARQDKAYAKCKTSFEEDGREIINLNPTSKLEVFKKQNISSIT